MLYLYVIKRNVFFPGDSDGRRQVTYSSGVRRPGVPEPCGAEAGAGTAGKRPMDSFRGPLQMVP